MPTAGQICADLSLLTSGPERYDWLFLDLNSYFASVEQQEDEKLRGRPVAVVPVMTDHTCAIAASREAKKFNIKTGTMIRDARQRCPQLICVLARHDVYVKYHHRVIEEVEHHLPVFKIASIDEMACQLTGKWREPENALALAEKIKAGLARNVGECVTCSIGLSTNRFLAKVATDLQKPDGLVPLHPRHLPEKLAHLVPRDLPGIGPNMEKRLDLAGIRTFEALWQCAPKQLHALWHGIGGERFWYALRGVELPDEPTQRSTVGHSHVLEPAQRPAHLAEAVGRRLLLKAASRLRRMEYLAGAMSLSVRLDKGPRLEAEMRFPPVSDSTTFQGIFTRLWAQVMQEGGGAPVKKVSVALNHLAPAATAVEQPDLFDQKKTAKELSAEQKEKRKRLSAAMDAITREFGRDAVTTGIIPGEGSSFTGTKIAFNRVPETADFDELATGRVRRKK